MNQIATFTIRPGGDDEITKFPLYHKDNKGDAIIVVEYEGLVVAYIMHTGNQVYFLESCCPVRGAGSALVDYLKKEFEELDAINCIPTSQLFWRKMGFEPLPRAAFSMQQTGVNMRWYRE